MRKSAGFFRVCDFRRAHITGQTPARDDRAVPYNARWPQLVFVSHLGVRFNATESLIGFDGRLLRLTNKITIACGKNHVDAMRGLHSTEALGLIVLQ